MLHGWIILFVQILPDPNEEPELWNLICTHQIHRHSKTCRKYRNEKYRFHFGKYFTSCTSIAEPLLNDIPEKIKGRSNGEKKEDFEESKRV